MLKEVQADFNILKAIDNSVISWNEVTSSNMNDVWKKLWPDYVNDSRGFDETERDIQVKIVDMGRKISFDDLQVKDAVELLAFRSEELTTEDLL